MAKKRPERQVSPEEEALFRAAMADAEPLARPRKSAARRIEEQPLPTPVGTPGHDGVTPTPRLRTPPTAPPPVPPLEAGRAAGLDRRTMDRLRKGRMRPEARLDLHGMTADAAHAALGSFLAASQAAGRRCVLVITGKGSLKAGGGVIRRELPAWLNAPGNRGRVLGFARAQPADGGSGAVYVLLRRRKPNATG